MFFVQILLFVILFLLFIVNFGIGQDSSTPVSERLMEEHVIPKVDAIQCPPETVVSIFGTFDFPASHATLEGTPVKMPCPYGEQHRGVELIFPPADDMQDKTDPSYGVERICYLINDTQKGLYGEWVVVPDNGVPCRKQAAHITMQDVKNILMTPQTITVNNVKQAPLLLLKLLEYSLQDYDSARTLIDSISRVLETSEIFTSDPEDPFMSTIKDQLLDMIETYTLYVFLKPGERVSIETTSMKVETLMFPTSAVQVSSYTFQSLQLSNEAISMARESTIIGNARLQMTSYSNDLFFHWGDERDWSTNSSTCSPFKNNTYQDDGFEGKWRIISLHFDGVQVENLTEPILYDIPVGDTKLQKEKKKNWVCVFWDTTERKWSSRGMRTLTFANSVRCESSHLTAFSALLDPIPMGNPNSDAGATIPSIHLHILSVLSSVGSALSITGLAVTTLTYGLFRCMRKERSNKILLHLCLSLLFLHLISLSSDKSMWNGQCSVPALLLHYFLLSSLAWMLVEGVHMYQLLISVFVKPETRFLLKRIICAYGLPLVIVGISGAIDIEAYNVGREEACLMAGHMPLYLITYLSPAIIILAINAFIFIRIIQVLCKQTSRTKQQRFGNSTFSSSSTFGKNKQENNMKNNSFTNCKFVNNSSSSSSSSSSSYLLSPVQIKGAITVMLLLGVGWILGLIAIGPFQLVFRYLFCICNAGQGVFIFLFRVILHPQACRTWRRAILGSSSMDSDVFSSGTGTRKGGQSRPSFSVSPTFVSNSNSAENSLTRSDPMSSKLAYLASLIHQNSSSLAQNNNTVINETINKHY